MHDAPEQQGDPPAPTNATESSRLRSTAPGPSLSGAVAAGCAAGMGLLFLFVAFTDAIPLALLVIGLLACVALVGRALLFEQIGERIERDAGIRPKSRRGRR